MIKFSYTICLDPNNTPAWDIPEQEKRPSSKMPLFVKTFPVFQASSSAEVSSIILDTMSYSILCIPHISVSRFNIFCNSKFL